MKQYLCGSWYIRKIQLDQLTDGSSWKMQLLLMQIISWMSPSETIPSWQLVIQDKYVRSTDNGSNWDNTTTTTVNDLTGVIFWKQYLRGSW